MHDTAMFHGTQFINSYYRDVINNNNKNTAVLLEIGVGSDSLFKRVTKGLPIEYCAVDQLHSNDPAVTYRLPADDASVDMVISSSCLEHDEFFWITYLEIMRVLKPHGLFYLNAPSNGPYHRYPVDCWRFYPDSAQALARWGQKNNIPCVALESFTGTPKHDVWEDYVAVILKDEKFANTYSKRISTDLPDQVKNLKLFS